MVVISNRFMGIGRYWNKIVLFWKDTTRKSPGRATRNHLFLVPGRVSKIKVVAEASAVGFFAPARVGEPVMPKNVIS